MDMTMSRVATLQLYLVAGITMAGVSAVFSLFAELEKRYDLTTTSLGWIAGTAFLASLASQLWLSRYADRGYAGLLLKAGALSAAAGLLWFAAATEIWQFLGARALLGAGVGMIVPPARRAIVLSADGAPGEKLGTFYGAYLAGFVFGPPIAGLLTTMADVRLPFLVFGLLSTATLVGVIRLELPEAERGAQPESGMGTDRRVLRRLLTSRRIVAAMLVVISFRYSIGVFEPLWATHLDNLGASTTLISFSLASFALPMLLVARPAGRLSDRFGHRRTSLLAALLTCPIMAIYGYAGVVWVILALAVPHGLLEAVLSPGSQAAIANAASDDDAASAQGLAEASGSAASAVGAFTAPALFDGLGPGPAWVIAGTVMAILLGTSWVMDRPTRPNRSEAEPSHRSDRSTTGSIAPAGSGSGTGRAAGGSADAEPGIHR
jgi:DHA1 family multidrug resistance protein-like MFS transporter